MNTRLLLSATAVTLGALGAAGLLMPHDIIARLGGTPDGATPVLVQLLGAAAYAFGMVNWTARGAAIGGIYNRAVAIGNLTHFVAGALVLGSAAWRGGSSALIALAVLYTALALAFARVFFSSPVTAR